MKIIYNAIVRLAQSRRFHKVDSSLHLLIRNKFSLTRATTQLVPPKTCSSPASSPRVFQNT